MADKAKVNYTPELEAQLKELYGDGKNGKTVAEIAAIINRTPKSVLGKLVHMKLYVAPEKDEPKGFSDQGPTKKQLQNKLAELGFSEVAVEGLGNATKPALAEVIERTMAATQAA